jgi:hypothetical protein
VVVVEVVRVVLLLELLVVVEQVVTAQAQAYP